VDEATRQEFYGVMLDDSDRLLGTIEQVLRAGQQGAKHRHARLTAVNFDTLVSECLSIARTRHRLAPETLSYRQPAANEPPGYVLGDEEDLKVVVSNLVDNAIKYSGPQVRVAVELEKTDAATITLRVRDQGIGIQPGQHKRIFKRFYRIPGSMAARVKGTGLGLFIVRSVVKRHGGEVYAESDGPGHGSTFVVRLPLLAPP
jgi:signal transduction histidine kinase